MLQKYFAQTCLTVMLESRTLVDAMTQQKPVVKKPVFAKPKKVTIPLPSKKKEQKKKKTKKILD